MKYVSYWCDTDCKILELNGCCKLSLYGVDFLVFSLVFGVDLFWTGDVADHSLGLLNSLCTLWGGVGCETGILWDGTGVENGVTGTLWSCKGREICDRVVIGFATRITIVVFWWLDRGFLLFWQVNFWLYHHIPVMVQLTVCFEGWQ